MQTQAAVLFGIVRVLVGTAALQAVAQLLAFVAGIVIVRYLTLEQYAFYTLAAAMLGVATTLADSGMRNAVMARAASVWQQPDRLGSVIAAGVAIRRKIALAGAIVICPVLIVLVVRQGGSYTQAVLLCGALLPVFMTATTAPLLEVPLRLHQRLKQLQLLQALGAVVRVACVLAALLIFPAAWFVVLSGLLPQLLLNSKLRAANSGLAHEHVPAEDEARKAISHQVLRAMPGTIYYVLVSQLTVILISIFGTTESVAHVGALSRLALVVSFLLAMFQLIALPRYARIPERDTARLMRAYLLLMGGIGAAAFLAVACAWIVPEALLYVLGVKYSGLTGEVAIAVAAGAVMVMASAASSLAAVRGMIVSPFVSIPPSIAVQALLIAVLPLDAVASVFWLSLAVSGVQAIVHIVYFLRRLHGPAGGSVS